MKRFGLIGHPIAHSMSPALFKAGYGGKYTYDLIEGNDFDESYRKFLDGYDGINVTAPFKEKAFSKADILSPECIMTGATNLMVKTPEGIKAYNSDYYGIILSILSAVTGCRLLPPRPSQEQIRSIMGTRTAASGAVPKKMKALVAGAGGAGRAAAVAAAVLGLETTIMNRTSEKAEKIVSELAGFNFKLQTRPAKEFPEAFHENEIVIYTLPGAPEQFGRQLFPSCRSRTAFVLEANYRNPSLAEPVAIMQSAGGGPVYIPGQQWLLYQAYSGYSLFTGTDPDLQDMSAALEHQ